MFTLKFNEGGDWTPLIECDTSVILNFPPETPLDDLSLLDRSERHIILTNNIYDELYSVYDMDPSANG